METRGAPTMRVAHDPGEARRLERIDTIADGLTAPIAGRGATRYLRKRVADVVVIEDADVLQDVRAIALRAKQVVEPAGAAAVGALLADPAATSTPTATCPSLRESEVICSIPPDDLVAPDRAECLATESPIDALFTIARKYAYGGG